MYCSYMCYSEGYMRPWTSVDKWYSCALQLAQIACNYEEDNIDIWWTFHACWPWWTDWRFIGETGELYSKVIFWVYRFRQSMDSYQERMIHECGRLKTCSIDASSSHGKKTFSTNYMLPFLFWGHCTNCCMDILPSFIWNVLESYLY